MKKETYNSPAITSYRFAQETFPNLLNLIEQEEATKQKDVAAYIQNGYFPTWSAEHRNDPDRGLKQHSTPNKWQAYQSGTLKREKAVEIATKRAIKEIEKETDKKINRLGTVAQAPELSYIEITVEWVRNSYWGNNPHTYAHSNNGSTEGRASGCGYDKRSASVAEALNENNSVLKALYTIKEKGLEEQPTGTSNEICGYGAGYGVLPYFEGGVGVNCFWNILRKAGFNCRGDESAKRYDHYSVTKEA